MTTHLQHSVTPEVSALHYLARLSRSRDRGEFYTLLGEGLAELIPDSVIIVNSVDQNRGIVSVEAIGGVDGGLLGRVVNALGFDPVGKTYELLPSYRDRYQSEGIQRLSGGLVGLAEETVPKGLLRTVQGLLSIGAAYTAGLLWNGHLIASVHLILRHREELEEGAVVEEFLAAASGLLQRQATGAELSDRSQELNVILDTTEAQLWYLTDETTYGAVNKAHAAFIGHTPESASFRPMSELFPPEVAATCRAGNRQVFATGESIASEEWLTSPEGDERLLSISKNPHFDREGRVKEVVCVGVDITESYRARERMVRSGKMERILTRAAASFLDAVTSEQLVRGITSTLENLAKVLDVDWGFFRIVDDALGLAPGLYQWHTKDVQALVPLLPDPINGALQRWQQLLSAQGTLTISSIADFETPETALQQRLLDQGVVAALAAPLYSAPGVVSGIVGFGSRESYDWQDSDTDIIRTFASSIAAALRRLKLEEQVRAGNERLSAALDGTAAAVWEWNLEDDSCLLDPKWAELLGYSLSELLPTTIDTWKRLVHPEDLSRAEEAIERHLTGETEFYDAETRMLHREGHKVWIHNRGRIVERGVDGEPLRMLGTATDITERKSSEVEIARSHALLESVFDGMQDGITILDREMRVVRMNSWMEARYGASEELSGSSCYGVFHNRARVCDDCPVLQASSSGKTESIRKRSRNLNGQITYVDLTAHPIKDQRGRITGFVEHVKDVTGEHQAQQALKKQERETRALFENMSAGFAVHRIITDAAGNPIDYLFLDVNPAFERLTGLPREKVIGKAVTEVFPGTDTDPVGWIQRYGEVALTGQAISFESYSRSVGRWFSFTAYSPGPELFATVFEDISQRKEIEESLAEKTTELERFFTLSLDLLAIADVEGHFRRLNAAWEDALGYPIEEMQGRRFLDFVHPEDKEATIEAMNALSANQAVDSFVNRYRGADGSYRWIEWRSHPLGNLIYAAARDVTDRIQREEAAIEASKAKSNFLANMSHELRTPLNGIVGFSDLLLESDIEGPHKAYLENIHTSAETLLALVNDILDFSKIEAGRMELAPGQTNLPELLEHAISSVRFAAGKKGLELTQSIDPQTPDSVRVDSVRLTQVLVNLLGNAVKFTDSGSIELKTVLKRRTRNSARIHFSVRDTGMGIAPEHRKVIFDSFTQADPSATRKFGGTGLGLAISNRIVVQMGGSLELDSALGEGSTFSFTLDLPLAAAGSSSVAGSGSAETGASSSALLPQSLKKDPKILLAEDERMNALVAQTMIKRILPEANVVLAVDGEEAVRLFKDEDPDLVLMDIQMPGLDGYAAARHIRSLESLQPASAAPQGAGARTPILALTAGVLSGERQRCLDAGMDDYLSKPIVVRTLENAFRDWL